MNNTFSIIKYNTLNEVRTYEDRSVNSKQNTFTLQLAPLNLGSARKEHS